MTNYNKKSDPEKEEKVEVDNRETYINVYPGRLNFRKEAGGDILFGMRQGERMKHTGKTDEYDGDLWLSMEARGKQGYVMAKYVERV